MRKKTHDYALPSDNDLNQIRVIYKKPERSDVAVIGCGWNGAHIASELAKKGFNVTVFEAKDTLFSGISGTFGIRIHTGAHYPMSYETRKAIHFGFDHFRRVYPELVCDHEWSIYAYGKADADNKPSLVSKEDFRSVVEEFNFKGEVTLEDMRINPKEIDAAYDIDEPSALLGPKLKAFFKKRLRERGVKVRYNFKVTDVQKKSSKIMVSNGKETHSFDHVINTSSFKSLLPEKLPLSMTVVYQPLLALRFRDKTPGEKPVSFITMAGMFPCLMPVVLDTNKSVTEYILTHVKYTTVGSYASHQEANNAFKQINDEFIEAHVKNPSLEHMQRLWPAFSTRFEYIGWTGSVLAKIRSKTEFRATVTFQDPDNDMIYVFPGKITNVFDAESETLKLMNGAGVKTTPEGFRFIGEGVLDEAKDEIMQDIYDTSRVVTHLQTHVESLLKKRKQKGIDKAQEKLPKSTTKNSNSNKVIISIDPLSKLTILSEKVLFKYDENNNGASLFMTYGTKFGKLTIIELITFFCFPQLREKAYTGIPAAIVIFVLFTFFESTPVKERISNYSSVCLFTPLRQIVSHLTQQNNEVLPITSSHSFSDNSAPAK